MSFNGTEGSPIDIGDASQLTKNWRTKNPSQPIAAFIGKDILMQALENEEAMGLRIYYGLDDNGKMNPVVVAADANENDVLDLVIDNSLPCPPRCSTANSLNS